MTKKNEAPAELDLVDGAAEGVSDQVVADTNAAVEPGHDKDSYDAVFGDLKTSHIALTENGQGYFVEKTHAERTANLIAQIDRHEAEGEMIQATMKELGHDVKSIRVIKRARAKAEAAKRTYDALFGAGLVGGE